MKTKLLKSYRGFFIEESWEECTDGNKCNIVYTAYTEDWVELVEPVKTLIELKQQIDKYIHDKWAVFGEYGGYFSNLKDAKQCAKFASKTEENDYQASIYNMHDGLYYFDYENGKCIRDGWTVKKENK